MSKEEMIKEIIKMMKNSNYVTIALIYNFVLGATSVTKGM